MSRRTPEKKDRTSLVISGVIHVILIGGVAYWAWKSGKLEMMGRKVLEWVKAEKKQEQPKEQPKQVQQKAPPKLPPIQSAAPTSSGGTRRAVAADAPAAAGDTFFVDTRTQTGGPATGGPGAGAGTNQTAPRPPPPPRPAASKSPFDLASRTNVGTMARLLQERSSASTVQDSFGSEQISRSGTSSAADVVGKITGASVVEGKHTVIRGLADRYNITTLNGAEVPSSDPYRRSVQVDVFNTDVIEKIVTTKTFSPDQPGSMTGGKIDIVTKSFPAKPFFNVSLETSMNENSNLKDNFLVAPGSKMDAFGPGNRPEGLSELLRAYPIDKQYPDPANFKNARPRTTSNRENQAGAISRRQQANELAGMLQSLGPTGFKASPQSSPLNQKYAFSAGQTAQLFERPLGLFVAANYAKRFSMYEHGIQSRFNNDLSLKRTMDDTRAVMETDLGGSVNLAYQLAPEHEVNFNFLFNRNLQDEAREQFSTYVEPGGNLDGFSFVQLANHYTERELQTYQVRGNHTFAALADSRLEWLASLSTTRQDEPDYRFYHNLVDANGRNNFASNQPQPDRPARYYRELNEQNLNLRADHTTPYRLGGTLTGEFKFGFYSSNSRREFFERTYLYEDNLAPYSTGDPNGYLKPGDLNYTTTVLTPTIPDNVGRTNYNFSRFLKTAPGGNNEHTGRLDVYAAYAMAELPLSSRLRAIGGARLETTDLIISGFNGITQSVNERRQEDLLPAFGLVYNLSSNMNLRFNWGQTIARPTFREIADYKSYDTTGDELLQGNPALKISSIQNYDVRWEWFPRPSEVISLGFFYKEITGPIEKFSSQNDGSEISYTNFPSAKLFGIEIEARKSLGFLDPGMNNFSVGVNFALIQSEVPVEQGDQDQKRLAGVDFSPTRPLYDQSPHILNLDLSYDNKRLGTSATLLANVTAERLYTVNRATENIYEHPPVMLDFVLSQRLGRHWKLKLSGKNLLNDDFRRTVGKAYGDPIYSSYTRGRTFSFSLGAEF